MRGPVAPIALRAAATRRPLGHAGLQKTYRDWLTHADSLTARLRARGGQFSVEIVFQGTGNPLPWERPLLGSCTRCHVREVLLRVDGIPMVWARTVLEQRALRGPWRFLSRLGTRPLGARLFTDPAITRSPFLFLRPHCLAFNATARRAPARDAQALRCALLFRAGKTALLTEVLLPAILTLE